MRTEKEAFEKICPELTLPEWNCRGTHGYCLASACMHWRWVPLMTNEPGWKEGLTTLIREGLDHKKAASEMLKPENKKRFKLPLVPYKGYCGVSGIPEKFT